MTTTDIRTGHTADDPQWALAGADPNSPPAKGDSPSTLAAPVEPNIPDGHGSPVAHRTCAVGDLYSLTGHTEHAAHPAVASEGTYSRNGHGPSDDHRISAVAGPTPEPTTLSALPKNGPSARDQAGDDHRTADAQSGNVVAPNQPGPATENTSPRPPSPVLEDPLLTLAADVLDDLERVRIANENRLRQLTRDEEDTDGEMRGFGFSLDHPDVKRLAALVDGLAKAEHSAELNLKRQLRQHPLGPWVKAARGVGEKQAARLLAAIGDPYIRPELIRVDGTVEPSRPRTVSELWAYAGYHVLPAGHRGVDTQSTRASGAPTGSDPDQERSGTYGAVVGVAATRARGQRANWSADAKMRAHLVAVSIVKAGGPYREVYDDGRAKYAASVHPAECKRCGPAGRPAQPGTPLSAGHQHARALRLVAKAILRDLWREAKRLHEEAAA